MAKAIVSFTTRPGQGTEGGVGWAFVSQAARWASARGEDLFVVFDRRDLTTVTAALEALGVPGVPGVLGGGGIVHLVPVAVPGLLLRRFGDRRTRETYLGWSLRARARVARLVAENPIDVVHQVTFATAAMPHVLPVGAPGVRTIWGPVALSVSTSHSLPRSPSWRKRAGVLALARLGRHHARHVEVLIATNELTRRAFLPLAAELEPNVMVDVTPSHEAVRDDFTLVMSGLLTERKRPRLAIEAMRDPRLGAYRLNIVGDGALRAELEGFAREIGVDSRVRFLGRLEHGAALAQIESARVLVHPSSSEGASWVVGEAAALGVPAVVFSGAGADSTVRLSANGGGIVSASSGDDLVDALVREIVAVLARPRPLPTHRWSSARIQQLLDRWWL